MKSHLLQYLAKAGAARKQFKKLDKKWNKLSRDESDNLFLAAHEEVFAKVDCLDCANCCKTTSPIVRDEDLELLARNFKMKPGDFIKRYLRLDEDSDFVFTTAPCPFLGDDNKCKVYDFRPKACREYPHTDRKHIKQIMNLTLTNTTVCPAVVQILERVNDSLNLIK